MKDEIKYWMRGWGMLVFYRGTKPQRPGSI